MKLTDPRIKQLRREDLKPEAVMYVVQDDTDYKIPALELNPNGTSGDTYTKAETDDLLSEKIDSNEKGQPSGVATLDNSGKIPTEQLPSAVPAGVTVVEYDVTDPANYVMQNLTLADFNVVEGSALIDTANGTFKADVPIDVVRTYSGQQVQYAAISLDSFPDSGTVTIDYSQKHLFSILFAISNQSITEIMQRIGYSPETHNGSFVNVFDFNDPSQNMFLIKNPTESDKVISAQNTQSVSFNIVSAMTVAMELYNLTTEQELINFLVDMGLDLESAIAYVESFKSEKQFKFIIDGQAYYSEFLAPDSKVYLAISPVTGLDAYSDLETKLVDLSWTANVEINLGLIEHHISPEIPDGTYLKIINGNCKLLGHRCFEGDYLLVYDNATQAILIRSIVL